MKKIFTLLGLLILTNSSLAAESARSVIVGHFHDIGGNKPIADLIRKRWDYSVNIFTPEDELYINSFEILEKLLATMRSQLSTEALTKSEIIKEKECILGEKMSLYSIGFKHHYADGTYSQGATTFILYNRGGRGWKISGLISSDLGKLIGCE